MTAGQRPRPAGLCTAGGQPRAGTALPPAGGQCPGGAEGTRKSELRAEHRPRATAARAETPSVPIRPRPAFGAHSPARWAADRAVAARGAARGSERGGGADGAHAARACVHT